MVSGVSGSSSYTQMLEIMFNDKNNEYAINGKAASEKDVNEALAPNGIVATQGAFQTKDGFELGTSHNGAATEFGDSSGVPLPDVQGDAAPPAVLANKAKGVEEMSLSAMMFMAMFEMARGNSRDQADATGLRHAMQDAKDKSKEASIDASDKQIAADRAAADEALITAVCVSVAVAAIQIAATLVGAGAAANSVTSTVCSFAQALAPALGAVATNAVDYASKDSGNQKESNKAKIEQKEHEVEEAEYDALIDTAKSAAEEAKEQFKLALKIILETVERQGQAVQAITR